MPTASQQLTPQEQAAIAAQNAISAENQLWLKYAVQDFAALTGSIPSGATGGQASSSVTWSTNGIPTKPRWLYEYEFYVDITVAVTVPAGGSVQVSNLAPYSSFGSNFSISGTPQQMSMSSVGAWLDEITMRHNYDPNAPGVGTGTHADKGATFFTEDPTAGGVFVPGATISNSGTAAVTTTGRIRFRVRTVLQTNPNQTLGLIPIGDPINRPDLSAWLEQLVGSNPERNLFVNGGSATAALSANAPIKAVLRMWRVRYAPQGTQFQAGTPRVGMARIQNFNAGQGLTNAGNIEPVQLRNDALYQKAILLVINGAQTIESDLFAIGADEGIDSSFIRYDATENTMQEYYSEVHKTYGRYLPTGAYVYNSAGRYLENPARDPRAMLLTPSVQYASSQTKAYMPAMTGFVRVPSGTTINGAYVARYTYEYVKVGY